MFICSDALRKVIFISVRHTLDTFVDYSPWSIQFDMSKLKQRLEGQIFNLCCNILLVVRMILEIVMNWLCFFECLHNGYDEMNVQSNLCQMS